MPSKKSSSEANKTTGKPVKKPPAKKKTSSAPLPNNPRNYLKLLKRTALMAGVFVLVLGSGLLTFYLFFLNRIYPGIYVGNINLSGLTIPQAQAKLAQIWQIDSQPLVLTYTVSASQSSQTISIDPSLYVSQINTNKLIQTAFTYGHSRFYYQPIRLKLVDFTRSLSNILPSALTSQVNRAAVNSQIILANNSLTITPSQTGYAIDQPKLAQQVYKYLAEDISSPDKLPIEPVNPVVKEADANQIKVVLAKIQTQPITLTFVSSESGVPLNGISPVTLDLPTLYNMIDQTTQESRPALPIAFDKVKIDSYFNSLSPNINQETVEPVFDYDQQSNRVINFQPPQEGRQLDPDKAAAALLQGLASPDPTHINVPIDIIPTKNQLVNKMGIKELLGEGVSHFAGSSSERIFNLSLAATRVNGSLVAPGDTFSFDKAVGDISGTTGYKEGYIIQNGRTVLDDGGGVCQDPTTLFRAVLYAGLPVVNRTAHAYRVEYYEEGFPPGLDATIYSPTVDFKFKNDTPGYILIETQVDTSTNTLYYDLYGTSDGRIAKLTTPIITSQTPAPPPLYQNDPTLPKGVVKQTDYAANGATVVFSRTVTRKGQTIIHDTYYSNYKPWQAVYLVGTKS